MRYYINQTGKPVTYHSWTLRNNRELTQNNAKTLTASGIQVRAEMDKHKFDSVNGIALSYYGNWVIEFVTTTKEQESMLKLMYGDDLILLLAEVVLPNTMFQHE